MPRTYIFTRRLSVVDLLRLANAPILLLFLEEKEDSMNKVNHNLALARLWKSADLGDFKRY